MNNQVNPGKKERKSKEIKGNKKPRKTKKNQEKQRITTTKYQNTPRDFFL